MMIKMSPRLVLSAAASTMAMAALAVSAPHIEHRSSGGTGLASVTAGMPATTLTLPVLLPR